MKVLNASGTPHVNTPSKLDGAALFYVSIQRPETLTNLKRYLLYRLLSKNPSHHGDTNQPQPSPPPFATRAQVVDRDVVFIPSGWDTWGKIKIIHDAFDCSAMAGLSEKGDAAAKKMYEETIKKPFSDVVSHLLCTADQ